MDNPIVWWELATQDADKSVKFLREVFGWELKFNEKLGFYVMEHPPKMDGGGVFTLKQAKLPFMALYIQVEDIQAMREKIVEHGGRITEEPHDLGSGTWICLFTDPSGVEWALIQPRKS